MSKVTKGKQLIRLFTWLKRFEEGNIQVDKRESYIPNTIYEYNLQRLNLKAKELEWKCEEDEDEEDAEEEEMENEDKTEEWEELQEKELLKD